MPGGGTSSSPNTFSPRASPTRARSSADRRLDRMSYEVDLRTLSSHLQEPPQELPRRLPHRPSDNADAQKRLERMRKKRQAFEANCQALLRKSGSTGMVREKMRDQELLFRDEMNARALGFEAELGEQRAKHMETEEALRAEVSR